MKDMELITRQEPGLVEFYNFEDLKTILEAELVGHNIKSSDLHYITTAANRAGVAFENKFFDTYLYAKALKEQQGWENVKLEYLSKVFGIAQNEAHRAWCDAEANVGVYFKLKEL